MTVLVSDSFNRADSVTLGTTDSYNGGTATAWTSITAAYGVSSNQAYPSTGVNDGFATVETNNTDVKITVNNTCSSNVGEPGIYFRATDTNNNFRVVRSAGSIYLQKKISGTRTTIASKVISWTLNEKYSVITKSDGTIQVYVNDVLQITATDTNLTTVTKHGIGNGTTNTPLRWDNFQVEDLATGGGSTGTDATITSVIATTTASALAPTVTAQKNTTVTSVITNAMASALAPTLSTSSSASATVSSVIANASASSLPPVITVQKQVSVSSVIASSTASGLAPQVGSFTNAAVNSVIANASASALNPSISTIRNISVVSTVSSAIASALIPSVVVPMSTQITAVMASVIADGLAPMIYLNQSIWKAGNKPSTAWLLPTDNKLTFAQLKNRKFNNYKATFGGKRVTIWT